MGWTSSIKAYRFTIHFVGSLEATVVDLIPKTLGGYGNKLSECLMCPTRLTDIP